MIAVFGANGFIGRHTVARLVKSGHHVRAISRRFGSDFKSVFPTVEAIEADLKNPLAVLSSLQDVDIVIQLVSTSSPALMNEHLTVDVLENVIPHIDFLRVCAKLPVRRVVFISSGGAVYGPNAPVPTAEHAPTNPISSHGLTKLMVEKYIQMHGEIDGLEYAILRVANPFGPGQFYQKGQGLIPAILDRWRRSEPIRILGSGESRRDYIYISDVSGAIEAAVMLPAGVKTVVNIGSGEARSVNEVVAGIETVTGHLFDKEFAAARATDVDVNCLDISKAEEVLGWTPSVPFLTGIRMTVESTRSIIARA